MGSVFKLGKLLATGLGFLSRKSDENPRAAAWVTVLGSIGGAIGIKPSLVATLGDSLVAVGTLLQNLSTLIGA